MASSATTDTGTKSANPGIFNDASGAAASAPAPAAEEPVEEKKLAGVFNTQSEINQVLERIDPNKKHKDGYRTINGTDVWTNTPQMNIGDAFSRFFSMLMMLFKDPERFQASIDLLYPKDVYKDPVERGERIDTLRKVVEDKNHPDRQKPVQEFVQKHFPKFSDLSMSPAFKNLFSSIIERESGGSVNVIYNYKGGRGLKPGDRTAGGLLVPDITQLTVNEVIDWQLKYIAEQKAAGIPSDKRSSAAGIAQFIGSTLRDMRDNGLVSGDAKFDLETQMNAALTRLYNTRRFQDFVDGKMSINTMKTELIKEWEGAKYIPTEKLENLLLEVKNEQQKPTTVATSLKL